MKNKLSDLNNHLFAQLERLGDEDLDAEQLKKEIDRGKAITGIANQIIANGQLVLDAHISINESNVSMPKMLGIDNDA